MNHLLHSPLLIIRRDTRVTDLAHGFKARLYADTETFLTVPIVGLRQNIVNVMEDIALVEELMVGLLELEAPASKTYK